MSNRVTRNSNQPRRDDAAMHLSMKARNNLVYLLFCLPMIAQVFIFAYMPMPGIVVAFKKYNYVDGLWNSPWVGLKNLEFFTKTPDAFRLVFNTIAYNVAYLFTTIVISVIVAILLNDVLSKLALKAYQTVMFFPYFMSYIVVAYIVYALLNGEKGMVNTALASLGMDKVSWYNTAGPWPIFLIIVNVWKSMGYDVILYYAAIIGIDPSYYEAASIEGATKFQMTRAITLPNLLPILCIQLILSVGRILNANFDLHYQVTMNSVMLYKTTDVLDNFIFRALTESSNYGMAAAVGLFKNLVGLVLVVGTNSVIKKIDENNSLF
jgi:putative aldouronate transport system permease protein